MKSKTSKKATSKKATKKKPSEKKKKTRGSALTGLNNGTKPVKNKKGKRSAS